MFKRSRKRIVAAIMSILVVLFLGTLVVIYASSYHELSARNESMLERHARMYDLNEHMDIFHSTPEGFFEEPQDDEGYFIYPLEKPPEENRSFELSTFYSVAIGDSDVILATDTGDRELYDEETLENYALEILHSGSKRGTKGDLAYLVEAKKGYTLVAFIDNTIMRRSMTTLLRNTFLFGSAALVLIFFLAVFLAGRIVKPLEESDRKQKQFISDAGHELKTPISVVNANAELLGRELGENRWLSNIRYENERMGRLVAQLLELTRAEQTKPKPEKIDFSRLVGGGVLPFESVAYEKGLLIDTQITQGVTVMGSPTQLSQLVAILTDNAICHSCGGSEITVRLTENRSHAILTVINAGQAIAQEQAQRLFERFYRIDEARTGDDKHYGLGLSIARAVVQAHRGTIEVHCHDGLVEFRATVAKS